jgi:hypothetical protein
VGDVHDYFGGAGGAKGIAVRRESDAPDDRPVRRRIVEERWTLGVGLCRMGRWT